jgi:polyribonucleotide nucleotidyltransferase
VVKTTTFGAFVSLLPGKDGLLHITQIRKLHGGRRIENIDDVVHIGDKIQVEIREVDDRGKLSLVPVEVLEREAAGEDLSGGSDGPRDRDGGDRAPRPFRGDRGERGDRDGERGGDGEGRRRTRHRSRGHHE